MIVDADNQIQFSRIGTSNAYFLSQGSRLPEYGTQVSNCLRQLLAGVDLAQAAVRQADRNLFKLKTREQKLNKRFDIESYDANDSYHSGISVNRIQQVDRLREITGLKISDLRLNHFLNSDSSEIYPRPLAIWVSSGQEGKDFETSFIELESTYGNQWIDFRKVNTEKLPVDGKSIFLIVDRSGIVQSVYDVAAPLVDELIARDLKSIMLGADLLQQNRLSNN